MENLNDLFENQLKITYSVEDQLTNALEKMAANANDEELQDAFLTHLKETQTHKERLEEIGSELGIEMSGKTCQTIKGIIHGAESFLSQNVSDAVKDAGLIAHAQQAEHHEIATYGTLCAFAEKLGNTNISNTLKQTLDEEKKTDKKLSEIASRINSKAEKK